VKQRLRIIIVLLFTFAFTACSNTEYTRDEKPKNKNTQTEAINMIANDEKIIEMLKKTGAIPKDASQEEISKALQKYLKHKAPGSLKNEKEKLNYINKLKEEIQKNSKN
jgi:bacillopeptidase F (M6 metalloprotease family)